MTKPLWVQFPKVPEDLHPSHPCYFKTRSEYWETYTGPVRRALATLDIPWNAPPEPEHGLVIRWGFPDRTIVAGVCYSDYPDLAPWAGSTIDLLMKMKYHPDREQTAEITFPVYPGGFCLAVGAGTGDTNAFLADELSILRETKDTAQIPKLFTTGACRHFNTYIPNRKRFEKICVNDWLDPAKYWWHLATHKWMLNVCGNGYSIDRKTVEACAIGCAIISDRGLEDLALPDGNYFIHGDNIWFVDGPDDVASAMEAIDGPTWERLVASSRALYESCFSPESMGAWYLKCAQEQL